MSRLFLVLIGVVLFLSSCEKEEGQGGTSTIKGEVLLREYNQDFTYLYGEYPAQDIDVFIIYGDDEVHGDRFKTGYDGKYEFEYLREGTYKVYALSKDTTNLTTKELVPVFQNVEITGKNQVVEVPTIIIAD